MIVSGPPGSGKTTVSAALASGYERGVHLESDWFFRSIRSGFVAPWLPDAHSQNAAVMVVAADAAAAYADAGYAVVWDGIVGPWFLGRVGRRLGARKIRVQYLVLRPRRVTASERVRRRGDTAETSGAEAMYDQFADLGEFEPHVVSSAASHSPPGPSQPPTAPPSLLHPAMRPYTSGEPSSSRSKTWTTTNKSPTAPGHG